MECESNTRAQEARRYVGCFDPIDSTCPRVIPAIGTAFRALLRHQQIQPTVPRLEFSARNYVLVMVDTIIEWMSFAAL